MNRVRIDQEKNGRRREWRPAIPTTYTDPLRFYGVPDSVNSNAGPANHTELFLICSTQHGMRREDS